MSIDTLRRKTSPLTTLLRLLVTALVGTLGLVAFAGAATADGEHPAKPQNVTVEGIDIAAMLTWSGQSETIFVWLEGTEAPLCRGSSQRACFFLISRQIPPTPLMFLLKTTKVSGVEMSG